MAASNFLLLDGKLIDNGNPIITADNRSFRYGEGFFDTMKWVEGTCMLWDLHVKRMYYSIEKMGFKLPKHFSDKELAAHIRTLIRKNKHEPLARVRCTFFSSEGGLYDLENDGLHILIQSWELKEEIIGWNKNGLDIGVFTGAIKVADDFSAIKSNSALAYVMAARFAKDNRYNDALLLNQWGRVADSTIANIFLVSKGTIYTPPLSEGGVAGVMQAWLKVKLPDWGYTLVENPITLEQLDEADEIFLSNAVRGVRWVKGFRGPTDFKNSISMELAQKIAVFQ